MPQGQVKGISGSAHQSTRGGGSGQLGAIQVIDGGGEGEDIDRERQSKGQEWAPGKATPKIANTQQRGTQGEAGNGIRELSNQRYNAYIKMVLVY